MPVGSALSLSSASQPPAPDPARLRRQGTVSGADLIRTTPPSLSGHPAAPGGTVFRSEYPDVPPADPPLHDAVLDRVAAALAETGGGRRP
ncbi:hypothetical protein GCM10022384_23820 [Streptomyces marokkonensis]|uniref:Uncharacterized protein n=1 Tax=Streptomyces marokkonensis TaxID=324855 RepID=A0ABP7PW28_9ACTN